MTLSSRARGPLALLALGALALLLVVAARAEPAAPAAWTARALAGLGVYALARELRLWPGAAVLAAAAHALAPPVSAGGIPAAAWLPWVLLGLERGRRPSAPSGLALAALAQAALVAAPGPSEVAGCSLAALAWCLLSLRARWRAARRGLAALGAGTALTLLLGGGPGLPATGGAPPRLDLLSLGLTLLVVALVVRARPVAGQRARALLAGLAAALLAGGLARRGLDARAGELLAPGLAPPRPGPPLPALPVPALGAALALVLGGAPAEPRQRRLAALAAAALLLALGAPGLGDLWRLLPLLAEVDPAGLAGAATLFLALAAGAGLESAAPSSRAAAVAALAGAAVLACAGASSPPGPELALPVDAPDEVLAWRWPEVGRVTGELDAGLPAERLRLRLVPLDGASPVRVAEVAPQPAPAPDGARPFELSIAGRLAPGRWLALLEPLDEAGEPLGGRLLGQRFVPPGPRALAAAALALALALALVAQRPTRGRAWAAALVVALAGLAGY